MNRSATVAEISTILDTLCATCLTREQLQQGTEKNRYTAVDRYCIDQCPIGKQLQQLGRQLERLSRERREEEREEQCRKSS